MLLHRYLIIHIFYSVFFFSFYSGPAQQHTDVFITACGSGPYRIVEDVYHQHQRHLCQNQEQQDHKELQDNRIELFFILHRGKTVNANEMTELSEHGNRKAQKS